MSSSDDLMQTLIRFRTALKESKNVVALAGAGLSAASGIPTFRGAGGLWRKHDALSLATPEAFHSNPSRVWQFYHMRMIAANKAQPNEAHKALAKACKKGMKLITQNVDGLSRRVHESGVCLEMHGCILETICTTCKTRQTHNGEALCDALIGTETLTEETTIPINRLPHCSTCSTSPDGRKGLLRPGVVWFGEQPRHMKEITTLLSECDLLLVVGTSSTVYPAAGFASIVKARGGKVAAFNVEAGQEVDFDFVGPCEEWLPRALAD